MSTIRIDGEIMPSWIGDREGHSSTERRSFAVFSIVLPLRSEPKGTRPPEGFQISIYVCMHHTWIYIS